MLEYLKKQGINQNLIKEIISFNKKNKVDEKVKDRIERPRYLYRGISTLEKCLYALLNGQNILLVGDKATGKNVLADNLCYFLGRPKWTVSFHNYVGSEELIGTDTYKNNEIIFRNGILTEAGIYGGFCILDELNMAKNESISVMHSVLDYRRTIDIPGYKKINLQDSTRFIATMNYGYLGTKELNEALISRFAVIDMPEPNSEITTLILKDNFKNLPIDKLELFADLFISIHMKAKNGELSTRALDLRGLIDSINLIIRGLNPIQALNICLVNKVFDNYEKKILEDLVKLNIPNDITFCEGKNA